MDKHYMQVLKPGTKVYVFVEKREENKDTCGTCHGDKKFKSESGLQLYCPNCCGRGYIKYQGAVVGEEIAEGQITEARVICSAEPTIIYAVESSHFLYEELGDEDLGKKFFLTREEAKKYLKTFYVKLKKERRKGTACGKRK